MKGLSIMNNVYGQIPTVSFESLLNATQNAFSKWSENTYAVNVRNTTCAIIFKFEGDSLKSTGLWSYQNKKFLSAYGDDKAIRQSQVSILEKIINAMTFWIEKAQVEKKPARKPFKKFEKTPLSDAQLKFLDRVKTLNTASQNANDEFTSKFAGGIIDMINKVGGSAKLSDKQKQIVVAKLNKYKI